MMRVSFLLLVLSLGILAGCSDSSSDPQNATVTPQVSAVTTEEDVPPPPPPPTQQTKTSGQPKASTVAATPSQAPAIPPGMVAEKADVGSGEQGRGYGQGIVSTPVAAYFLTRQNISFNIQIPELVKAYKFEHDLKGPPSHDVFMKDVIQKYGIRLPELPPGHKYLYDPKEEMLMVVRPAG
jgi:hypothetical protein